MKLIISKMAALLAVLLVAAGALAFVACDDGSSDDGGDSTEISYTEGIATAADLKVYSPVESARTFTVTSYNGTYSLNLPSIAIDWGWDDWHKKGFSWELYGSCTQTGKKDVKLGSGSCESGAVLGQWNSGTTLWDNLGYDRNLYGTTSGWSVSEVSSVPDKLEFTFYVKTTYGSESKTSDTLALTLTKKTE